MGIWGDITGWIGDNKDWLKPIASVATGVLKQSQADNSQKQYLDYLKQRENQNYQDTVNQINDYNARGASSSAAAASRAAAARANAAAQQAAAKKANKAMQKTYAQILAMYAPYKQTADTLLPQMTKTYQDSLGLQGVLSNYVNSPAQMAKLDAVGPAWNVNIPLPDSVRIK